MIALNRLLNVTSVDLITSWYSLVQRDSAKFDYFQDSRSPTLKDFKQLS